MVRGDLRLEEEHVIRWDVGRVADEEVELFLCWDRKRILQPQAKVALDYLQEERREVRELGRGKGRRGEEGGDETRNGDVSARKVALRTVSTSSDSWRPASIITMPCEVKRMDN